MTDGRMEKKGSKGKQGKERTYDSNVSASDHRHLSSARVLLVNIPNLDELVRSSRREAASHVRRHVEGRSRALVSGEGELGRR